MTSFADVERFFDSSHLPEHLAVISQRFEKLKDDLKNDLGADAPMFEEGIHHLLNAKNCFVQAAVAVKGQVEQLAHDATTSVDNPPVES